MQDESQTNPPEHDHGPSWQAELIRFLVLVGIFVIVIAVIAWSRPLIFGQVVPSVLGTNGSTAVLEPAPDARVGIGGIEHVVQEGEDLYQIAQQYGVTAGAILAANEIAGDTAVVPGTVLVIPAGP